MAKLKAPLMSLGASGKLGNALVFFGWKGLDVVREYVIPTNPKSPNQKIQRDYLKDAVAKIHAAQGRATNPLRTEDQTAYALLGSTRPTPRTWFNTIVKLWIDCEVLDDDPVVYSCFHITGASRIAVTGIGFLNEQASEDLGTGKFYMGLTKTNLIHAYDASIAPGATITLPENDISGWASVGDKVFVQFRPDSGDDCEGADSGIYHFTAEA